MSKVAVIFKIYPKENGLDTALREIKDKLKPAAIQSEDVAFGIKVIKARFVFDDANSSSSNMEDSIRKLDGVGEVEVEEESLI